MEALSAPVLVGAAASVLVVVGLVAVLLVRRRTRRFEGARLPAGADAAIWSITEVVPDPRNHLALTRDLSGEVRLSDADRHLAADLWAAVRADTPRVVSRAERPSIRAERVASVVPTAGPGEEAAEAAELTRVFFGEPERNRYRKRRERHRQPA